MKKVLLALAAASLMAAPAMAAVDYTTVDLGQPSSQFFGGADHAGKRTKQYHSYDGLICTDCHTLHNSEDGASVAIAGYPGGSPYRELLFRGDWTDMCLSCHKEGQNTSGTAALPDVTDSGWIAPIVMTLDGYNTLDGSNNRIYKGFSMPAGDFYYSNIDPAKGHNPAYSKQGTAVAGVYPVPSTVTSVFMAADTTLGATPPGSALGIQDGEWSCHSCHGMHSRFSGGYTAYRQIKRKVNGIVFSADVRSYGVEDAAGDYTTAQQASGYEPLKSNSRGNVTGGVNNTNYNNTRKDGQALDGANLWDEEGDANKNVYRGGFSSFCATCHGNFHSQDGQADKTLQSANTRVSGAWVRHPTNLVLSTSSGIKQKYGVTPGDQSKGGYNTAVTNSQGVSGLNPIGYDWRYPLVVNDNNTGNVVAVGTGSATVATTITGEERIMCLTCHKAHASQFANMTRWDAAGHAALLVGEVDPFAAPSAASQTVTGDNPAFGCGKCHQKAGSKAIVRQF